MESAAPTHPPWRPTLGVEAVVLLASLLFAAAYNGSLWQHLFGQTDFTLRGSGALFASLFIVVVCLQFAGLALIATQRTVKPLLAVIVLATALASFFMDRYRIFLNADMLRNILHTDPAEASELWSAALLVHLALYAALPIALLSRLRIRALPWRRAALVRSGSVAGAVLVACLALVVQYRDAATLLRAQRDARHLVTPTNYLAALYKVSKAAVSVPAGLRARIGLDAHRIIKVAAGRRPTVLVLVIGETVRSANFGLSGYARQTTPELSHLDLLVYPRVQACGTSTEISLPCLFARVGRRDYDEQRIQREDTLLHVLDRVGIDVTWIDNQSGCKGVCEGLALDSIGGDADPALCDGERCLDGILLQRLSAALAHSNGDAVVVLHMLGNHGPAYSHRYPPEFRFYTPTCDSRDISECSPAAIVNAYDNAVRYTDHVLAGIIRYLDTLPDRDAGLIYVSDHGESLGEAGLYLHGLPYRIAPAVQREVPMLAWLSQGLQQHASLDRPCLQAGTTGAVTHDHFFHSVLGLLQVTTAVREPSLDLFDSCRIAATGPLLARASVL
jgi:lipid A ethanolaminephosphotransferase